MGWTVRGSNHGGGEILRTLPDRPWIPPMQGVPGLFTGGKAAGAWRSPPTPPRAEVKEKVEPYFCSPLGPSEYELG